MPADTLPEFHESSLPAVRLLQGVVYAEDEKIWNPLKAHQSRLDTYFSRIGLLLIVDEAEGFAYLRQMGEDDALPAGYEKLPVLISRKGLGYPLTILAILLRDALRRFDEEELHDERCIVETEALFDDWRGFQKPTNDEPKQRKEFTALLRRAEEEFGFLKKFATEPESWEIRRILKARLPVTELENLQRELLDFLGKGAPRLTSSDNENG